MLFNKTYLKGVIITLFSGIILVSFNSCDENVSVNNGPSQLFRPILFSVNTKTTPIVFTWVPIKDASYLLEISHDSLEFNTDLKSDTLKVGTKEFDFSDFTSGERYSARIKSVSSSEKIQDSEFSAITFKAP